MARLTNEHLHGDIKLLRQDIEYMRESQSQMQNDISMIKRTLLGPDTGAIARVNKNTTFRKNAQKTIWSIWIVLLGILGKMIFWD
tara:strand:- start:334 stop:588 length:255 start_codon:yes stop_codon:yes gene_type:complete